VTFGDQSVTCLVGNGPPSIRSRREVPAQVDALDARGDVNVKRPYARPSSNPFFQRN
jgi:hypothetical protein